MANDHFKNLEECWKAAEILTPERRERLRAVLAQRLQSIHLVLDNVDDPGNRSAVFRSADAFGITHIHVINERGPRTSHRGVSMKADQWLMLHPYASVDSFIQNNQEALANDTVMLSQLTPRARPLPEVFTANASHSKRIWIVFGNEKDGISPQWSQIKTHSFWIPMVGFSESFNISVAAALTLYTATQWKRTELKQLNLTTDLSISEQCSVLSHWLMNHDTIARQYPARSP